MWLVRGLQAVNLDSVDSLNVEGKEIRITFHNGRVWTWVFSDRDKAEKVYIGTLVNMNLSSAEVISMED